MRITISQRLRPFSHAPGDVCMLPGTLLAAKVFPALLIMYDLSGECLIEVAQHRWNVKGPVKDFTVQQDLEKGQITAWGHAQNGFFKYRLLPNKNSYAIVIDKAPECFGESFNAVVEPLEMPTERLSLGVDKQQDWTLVKRRLSAAEIFPFWLRLGSITPITQSTNEGTAALLDQKTLTDLLAAGFEGMLLPRLTDADHQGFDLPNVTAGTSPACILSEGASCIRSLFFEQKEGCLHILQNTPKDFHSGRFINIDLEKGQLDLEWRSRKLRRMVFRCSKTFEYSFVFPTKLKTFRLRDNENHRGLICSCEKALCLSAGSTYYFDLFEY